MHKKEGRVPRAILDDTEDAYLAICASMSRWRERGNPRFLFGAAFGKVKLRQFPGLPEYLQEQWWERWRREQDIADASNSLDPQSLLGRSGLS